MWTRWRGGCITNFFYIWLMTQKASILSWTIVGTDFDGCTMFKALGREFLLHAFNRLSWNEQTHVFDHKTVYTNRVQQRAGISWCPRVLGTNLEINVTRSVASFSTLGIFQDSPFWWMVVYGSIQQYGACLDHRQSWQRTVTQVSPVGTIKPTNQYMQGYIQVDLWHISQRKQKELPVSNLIFSKSVAPILDKEKECYIFQPIAGMAPMYKDPLAQLFFCSRRLYQCVGRRSRWRNFRSLVVILSTTVWYGVRQILGGTVSRLFCNIYF